MDIDTNSKEVSKVDLHPAIAPKELSNSEADRIRAQASSVVKELVLSDGSSSLTIEDKITNVGIQDQKAVSGSLALLQERMGSIFFSNEEKGKVGNLTKDIADLQTALARVNPKDMDREAKFRILKLIPFFGNRIVLMLKTASDRRLTLQQFVQHLEDSLKAGETTLRQDNAQLKVMYQDIETKERLINTDAFFAEVLMEELDKANQEEKDEKKKARINKVLFKVATRAQDLRAMENIHQQFYTSIEMTRDNNDMLIATVQRLLTMGMDVVNIAFAIHSALVRQKNVLEAEKGTREFLGNLILKNATMINSHVAEIGDLYKEPVVAMDKLEKSISQLEQAIDATNKLKIEGITRARENIGKIKIMTEELKSKAGQLPDSDIRSLEASKTLQLVAGPKA